MGKYSGRPFEDFDHATPLPPAETCHGAPAYDAIRRGLGAYLESQGYVAEHPLLYVNESEDPYVFVRFIVSDDGRSYRDETYVFSPGVHDYLQKIYYAYGIWTFNEAQVRHTSDTHLFGRPIHVSINLLSTIQDEEVYEIEFKTLWDYTLPAPRIKVRSKRDERRIRRQACRRRRRLGKRFARPHFGYSSDQSEPEEIIAGPEFRALPLNWPTAELTGDDRPWWLADASIQQTADAHVQAWRDVVELRLPHAAHKRGKGVTIKSWQYGAYEGDMGGNGLLGDEWQMHDRLYWIMKMLYETMTKYGDELYRHQFADMEWTLFDQYRFGSLALGKIVESRLENARAGGDSQSPIPLKTAIGEVVADPEVQTAAWLYSRQAAVFACRDRILPGQRWRQKSHNIVSSKSTLAEYVAERA